MADPGFDPRGRRLLVSQAPLDQVPATAFLPALSGALGAGVVLSQRLSPDASEPAALAAARALAGSGSSAGRWRWSPVSGSLWPERLGRLASALEDTAALYFSVRWGTLGALRVAPAMILPHAITLAGQSLGCLLTTQSGEEGLRLDMDGGEFELTVWGERWLQAVTAAAGTAPHR
jgi:hypothetical protein